MNELNFDEFPEISAKQWKQKIQFELQGADYNTSLNTTTPEGIIIKPFYTFEDLPKEDIKVPHKSSKGFKIAQRIYAANALKANEKAIHAIQNGATAIIFTLPKPDVDVAVLFGNIPDENINIYLEIQFTAIDFTQQLANYISQHQLKIYSIVDPIHKLATTGNWYQNVNTDFNFLKDYIPLTANFSGNIAVNGSLYADAGANITQQLAYTIAHANEYLDFAYKNDLISQIKVTFQMAMGSNYFFEIAKIRALRILIETVFSQYESNILHEIIAQPSTRNKTIFSSEMNMVRSTTEMMSAIIGEADVLCNSRYDDFYNKDNEFGERIARNQLLLLTEESDFNKVINPADGAYYIENITHQLAEKALALFKQIEAGGGFLKQLKSHTIQRKIKENANWEQQQLDLQYSKIVGSNLFPDFTEKPKEFQLFPFLRKEKRKTLIEPILPVRLTEKLEQERLKNGVS